MNESESPKKQLKLPTRNDLQLTRRLFHFANGLAVAGAYGLLFTREEAISLIGVVVCVVYLLEQIRLNYPELAKRYQFITQYIMRAEEQVKESAMLPYAIGILLSIITFPKLLAIYAILILAIADPLSAVIGINYGKRKWSRDKTLEGSAAFAIATLIVAFAVFYSSTSGQRGALITFCLTMSLLTSLFEALPIKLDDNLTLPLFSGAIGWPVAVFLELNF